MRDEGAGFGGACHFCHSATSTPSLQIRAMMDTSRYLRSTTAATAGKYLHGTTAETVYLPETSTQVVVAFSRF